MYVILVYGYLMFIVSFTIVSLKFEDMTDCYRPGTHFKPEDKLLMQNVTGCIYTEPEVVNGVRVGYSLNEKYLGYYIIFVILYIYSFTYNLVMTVHEIQQLIKDKLAYFKSVWNLLDLTAALITFASIGLSFVNWARHTADDDSLRTLDVIQAHALLFGWIKVLYYLRGLDTTSFLVNMLKMIIVDMAPFLIVLVVVLLAFGFSFHLMLRHDLEPPEKPNGEVEDTMFDSFFTSIFAVLGMMFGAFELAEFREALSDSHIGFGRDEDNSNAMHGPVSWFSLIDLTFFLLIVPLVMLNALIAIMSDTYQRVQADAFASKIYDRCELILEMEG